MENDSSNSPSNDASPPHAPARVLAHDLRNAVAPIRNAVELLRLRGGADTGLAPIIDIIERQVNAIVRMLNAAADSRTRPGEPSAAADRGEGEMPRSTAGATGRRILIVDDNAAFLTSLSSVLRETGHAVKTAADGVEAVALAREWKPDFVLLDVHMPRMNGFEAARQLRALFAQDAMKLVLMTGSTLDETTMRGAERAGFDHCIDKIHDFAALDELLRGNA
jgi:CheY-like chemotaxis protein